MRNKILTTTLVLTAFAAALGVKAGWNDITEIFISPAHAQEIDGTKVEESLGRNPAVSGDVRRYGFPRSDLSVTLDGVAIKTGFALGGWIAFKPAHGGVMARGD